MLTLTVESCTACTFSPFCSVGAEQKNASAKKHEQLVAVQHYHLKRNETLCLPKNKFQHLYAIQQGALKSFQVEPDGKELIRGLYFSGEIVGYESIYTGHYLYSIVALTDTIICEIPYDDFLKVLHANPELQKHILYLISQQLNVGSYLSLTTAEQRLAAFLIDLSIRLNPKKLQSEFILPMSRQDIGNYLRLTAETISRIFSKLQKNNIIEINHKEIRFLQLELLKQISSGMLSINYIN